MKTKALLLRLTWLALAFLTPQAQAEMTYAQMLEEVRDYKLPVTNADFDKRSLRWDFAANDQTLYVFDQSMSMRSIRPGHDTDVSEVSTQMNLELRKSGDTASWHAVGDNKADFTIRIGDKTQQGSQAIPAFVLDGYLPTGNFIVPEIGESISMQLWFILPTEAVGLGQTISEPARFPTTINKQQVYGHGQQTWTVSRTVECGDSVCLELDIDLDTSKLVLPENITNKLKVDASIIGASKGYFDIKNNRFFGFKGAFSIHLKLYTLASDPVMGMAMDTIFRVKEQP